MNCWREFTSDLCELLVVDLPDTVVAMGEEDVVGREVGGLWERARLNNSQAAIETRLELPTHGDLAFTAAMGDSFFFASRAADL